MQMSDGLTLRAISAYNGNLHNGMTAALEAVVAMVLEEAARAAQRITTVEIDGYDFQVDGPSQHTIVDAIRALKEDRT